MTKHTPGPWKTDANMWIRNRMGDTPNWGYVAQVFDPFTHSGEANARLIAAAPELLNEIEEWHTFLIESATDDNPNKEAVLAKALQVAAVIAKARGEVA